MLVLTRSHGNRTNLFLGTKWLGAVIVDLQSDPDFIGIFWTTVEDASADTWDLHVELTEDARMTLRVEGRTVVFTMVEATASKLRLGVEAPPDIIVLREECGEMPDQSVP